MQTQSNPINPIKAEHFLQLAIKEEDMRGTSVGGTFFTTEMEKDRG